MRKLIMPCPRCTHEHKFYSESWIHARCGGELYINSQGIVCCKVCGKKAHITEMYMSCIQHDYFRPTRTQVASAITTGAMHKSDDSAAWLIKFLKNL